MVTKRVQFIESARLFVEANNFILAIAPLQARMQACHVELMALMDSHDTPDIKKRIHDLNDEIFSCKIEIDALRIKSNRLLKQARSMRYADILEGKAKLG